MEPALQAKFNLRGSEKVNIAKKEAFEVTESYKVILSKFYVYSYNLHTLKSGCTRCLDFHLFE